MSLYRTDTKILSIPNYTPFIDSEAMKFHAQWAKDPSKFKYQVTLQVTGGLIDNPTAGTAGIFVNMLYTSKSGALNAYKKLSDMFAPMNGNWHVLLSVIDRHKIQEYVPTKPAAILDLEVQ